MTVDSRRLGKNAAELDADHTDWVNSQTVTQRCLFCAWTWEGTAEEGRRHGRQHRATEHPHTVQPKTRDRKVVGLDTPEKLADARVKGTSANQTKQRKGR